MQDRDFAIQTAKTKKNRKYVENPNHFPRKKVVHSQKGRPFSYLIQKGRPFNNSYRAYSNHLPHEKVAHSIKISIVDYSMKSSPIALFQPCDHTPPGTQRKKGRPLNKDIDRRLFSEKLVHCPGLEEEGFDPSTATFGGNLGSLCPTRSKGSFDLPCFTIGRPLPGKSPVYT